MCLPRTRSPGGPSASRARQSSRASRCGEDRRSLSRRAQCQGERSPDESASTFATARRRPRVNSTSAAVDCSSFIVHRSSFMTPRAIVIVCDSLGVGELPDAKDFGDEGSNTLGHVLESQHPSLPTLARLGLLHALPEPATDAAPLSAFGRMNEVSAGKDTTTGHWEMMGLVVADPFNTYPNGFPESVIKEYEKRIGRRTRAHKAGRRVVGLGKIADIFDRVGIDTEIRTESNSDGMRKTIDLIRQSDADFIFTNLVDFDSKYGHRNDAPGYAKALETFDGELAALLESMRGDDLLFITADHGCDPTDVSTDHTREYVPMLIAGPRITIARPLGT